MALSDPPEVPLTEAAIRLSDELNGRNRRLAEFAAGDFRFVVERGQEAIWLVAHRGPGKRPFRVVADYEADNVSLKVVRIILSYTDYMNRTVWRK